MESTVKRALGTTVFKATGISGGGCISSGSSYLTDNGTVFVKVNHEPNAKRMFEGEKVGLEAILATGAIKCPKPIAVVTDPEGPSSALVMENLNMRSLGSRDQAKLGEQLARMHLHNKVLLEKSDRDESKVQMDSSTNEDTGVDFTEPITKFGFYVSTSCGYLSQDNSWQDDWTTFFVRQKLQAQVDLILSKESDRELSDIWPICKRKVEEVLSSTLTEIVPALVHGDLWSGNVASVDNVPVIFDPAAFYGHSEFDFGIANMFGGFSASFYESYHQLIPKSSGFSKRENIYELFHHLNHWNHFGTGYRGSSLRLMKAISKL